MFKIRRTIKKFIRKLEVKIKAISQLHQQILSKIYTDILETLGFLQLLMGGENKNIKIQSYINTIEKGLK